MATHPAVCLPAVLLATCLAAVTQSAQEDPAVQERRRQLLLALTMDPQQRAARMREATSQLRLSQTPRQAMATSVVMPERGDVIRLRCANSTLELRRRGEDGAETTCGSWQAMMPGPFDARAFGPDEIVVAMQTGNASPQTTVLRFTRAAAAPQFTLAAQCVVRELAWATPQPANQPIGLPSHGRAIARNPTANTVTMVFAAEGLGRFFVAEVPLTSTAPAPESEAGGHRLRVVADLPSPVTAKVQVSGEGIGVEALEVDGALLLFVRPAGSLGRQAGVRVHARSRDGTWQQAVHATDVLVEPEFVAWRDADGAVHLTTPVSAVREGTGTPAVPQAEFAQTLRTWRMDAKDPSRWTPASLQFAWTGSLRLGQQLRVVSSRNQPPTVMLETTNGELVEQQAVATGR